MDISRNNLYFKNITNVIHSEMRYSPRARKIDGRHSDAFIYIIDGGCKYTFDNGYSFTVKKGDILYLADKSVYNMVVNTEKYEFIFCDFKFEASDIRKSDVYSPKSADETEKLFRRLLRCYKYPTESSFAECMSILYKIYAMVRLTAGEKYVGITAKQKLQKIKNYIDTNFQDTSISIPFLADMCKMSDVYFRKLFKSIYGVSPSQYIIAVRLNAAKELMKYPFLSIEECALQSGFSSMQYFCRIFKRENGITPSDYKKAYK